MTELSISDVLIMLLQLLEMRMSFELLLAVLAGLVVLLAAQIASQG